MYGQIAEKCQDKARPCLAIVHANDRTDSHLYIKRKIEALLKLKFDYLYFKHEENTLDNIRKCILELNDDSAVHGVIVQSPLHDSINFHYESLVNCIAPEKDVDGLGRNTLYTPCTALAIVEILQHYSISIHGKHALIIGRSKIVGEPIAKLMNKMDATVTVAHSETPRHLLDRLLRTADIIVSAVGQPGIVDAEMVRENAVLIDVGIAMKDARICGDVSHSPGKHYYYTPVPGGVGPVTVAKLVNNLCDAFFNQNRQSM